MNWLGPILAVWDNSQLDPSILWNRERQDDAAMTGATVLHTSMNIVKAAGSRTVCYLTLETPARPSVADTVRH